MKKFLSIMLLALIALMPLAAHADGAIELTIPHYKSGSNDLFDPDLYEVRDKRFMKSGRKAEATSGISYSALRSKKNHN